MSTSPLAVFENNTLLPFASKRFEIAFIISSVLDSTDKTAQYVGECKRIGVRILPPDINRSEAGFTVEQNHVRVGLLSVRNLGNNLIDRIISERRLNGDYKGLHDFCIRMNNCEMNKRALESLVLAGAFDSIDTNRRRYFESVESILSECSNKSSRKITGQMGLFDEKLKKPVPIMPRKIAVVTSLTGAALQDILNVLSRRYPICEVVVSPAQVQGEFAHESICKALELADNCGADTIILARGGGSLEDLMPFNTEEVAMAVSACRTPVITAVGHETDTSVVDYVADLRAPTPSAAAELASPQMSELMGAVDLMTGKMKTALENSFAQKNERIIDISGRLKLLSPEKRLENNFSELNRKTEKLDVLVDKKIRLNESRLDRYTAQLSALSPLNVLERGYSITAKDNKVVTKGEQLSVGDVVEITFSDTKRQAQII